MAFQPSEFSAYGAMDANAIASLIGTGIQVGGGLASQAIAGGAKPKKNKKKAKQDQLDYIAAAQPDYNPMWVVAGAIVVVGVGGFLVFRKKAA